MGIGKTLAPPLDAVRCPIVGNVSGDPNWKNVQILNVGLSIILVVVSIFAIITSTQESIVHI